MISREGKRLKPIIIKVIEEFINLPLIKATETTDFHECYQIFENKTKQNR